MSASKVHFTDFRVPVGTSQLEKLRRLIDRAGLEITATKDVPEVHLWMWQGMIKTLVNVQWSLWEEDSPEGKLRIKIAKKVDKFC